MWTKKIAAITVGTALGLSSLAAPAIACPTKENAPTAAPNTCGDTKEPAAPSTESKAPTTTTAPEATDTAKPTEQETTAPTAEAPNPEGKGPSTKTDSFKNDVEGSTVSATGSSDSFESSSNDTKGGEGSSVTSVLQVFTSLIPAIVKVLGKLFI